MNRSRSRKAALRVTARRTGRRITEIDVTGHAGFAPYGRDIVCAATSALVLAAAYGLRTHCGASVHIVDEPDRDYRLIIKRTNARAQAVLESALSGLRAISRSYPGTLRIRTLEGKAGKGSNRSGPSRPQRK